MERITREDMAGKLTCDLGVGVGELATDDDLIRLCPVKVTAGLGELAEEVADEPLGALVQILEVGEELNGGVSTEMRSGQIQISDAALTRKRGVLPEARTECWRSTGRTLAGTLVAGHLLRERRRGWCFWRA